MIVVDTNVLVYATLKDSKFFNESVKIIEREDVIIPQIVIYEYIKVLTEIRPDLNFIKTKIEELKDFKIIPEDIETISKAIDLLNETSSSLKNINDFIILSLTLKIGGELATFDNKLRKIAEKKGIKVIP